MNENVNKIMSEFPDIKFIMIEDGQIDYILENLDSVLNLPGDVVELGCYVGVTTTFIRRLLDVTMSNKELHVYESFQGLPEKLEVDGAFHFKAGTLKASKQMLLETFEKAGVKLPVINDGWFAEIPDKQYPDKICFAFFDGDFYTSIIDSFEKVYHKMTPGGIILIHDYKSMALPGVEKACDEFLKDKPENMTQDIYGVGKMVKQ